MIHIHATVICDQCGANFNDDFADEEDAIQDARDIGWQASPNLQYCPNHWHVGCRECRTADNGPRHRLEYQGWKIDTQNPGKSLCPDCAKGTR